MQQGLREPARQTPRPWTTVGPESQRWRPEHKDRWKVADFQQRGDVRPGNGPGPPPPAPGIPSSTRLCTTSPPGPAGSSSQDRLYLRPHPMREDRLCLVPSPCPRLSLLTAPQKPPEAHTYWGSPSSQEGIELLPPCFYHPLLLCSGLMSMSRLGKGPHQLHHGHLTFSKSSCVRCPLCS